MSEFIGSKFKIDLYKNLFKDHLPKNLSELNYVAPFGGSFGLYRMILKVNEYSPLSSIYNDLNKSLLEDYKKEIIDYANIIHNFDFSNIFEKYDGDGSKSFFYIDPPYIDKEYYYNDTFNGVEDHYKLSENIKELKSKWMLSYIDNDLIREWYKDYNFYTYKGNSYRHKTEIIITNYKL